MYRVCRIKKVWLLSVLLLLLFCGTECDAATFVERDYKKLSDNPWEYITPYLIPENHFAKIQLDTLFHTHGRIIKDRKSLLDAGFKLIKKGRGRRIYVFRHPDIPGFVVKLYTDSQVRVGSDWKKYLKRIDGAILIQNHIEKYGFQSMFKVPKKWIYTIPAEVKSIVAKKKTKPKQFILVAEDMTPLTSTQSREKWTSEAVTPALLDALFLLVSELGLYDTLYLRNLPFSTDGKLVLIDTEYFFRWPVKYRTLLRLLSREMQEYWKLIIQEKKVAKQFEFQN